MEYRLEGQYINGGDILRWFASGASEVYTHVKHLNRINVFPVADGDTGTNLATTMRAMVEKATATPSFGHMLQNISQSGLEGARGNSGIIFASYINGLALEGQPYENVTIAEFAKIVFGAVPHLYAAVEKPMEGTLMSVIRDWAKFIQQNCKAYHTFDELLKAAYRTAVLSLEKTKTQLDVLRRFNVVDAGAAGFVRFLEGINRAFSGAAAPGAEPDVKEDEPLLEADATGLRYCTEALVALSPGQADPTGTVRLALHPLGDSLIVSARGDKLKVHIHTNSPELVMAQLLPFGKLVEQKADDMYLQNTHRAAAQGGIGLVTDSTADLPDDYLLAHGITVLPMGVLVDDAAYLDKLTLKLPQLFPHMESVDGYPTSSQPEPARIRTVLAARLEQVDSLIVLSVADKLSGTYRALVQAAQSLQTPDKKITVLDSRLNSGALGLLVRLAGDMIAKGHTHDEIVAALEQRIPRTNIYVCLNTLAYAVRGGRVPNTVGQLGIKFGMRPIMTLDRQGHGAAFGVAFSQEGLTRKILRLVRKVMKRNGIEAYSIVHGGNLPLALKYQEQLTRIVGKPPAFVSEISSVIALHAGPGTVAVSLIQKERETA